MSGSPWQVRSTALAACACALALALALGCAGCSTAPPEPRKPTNARAATAVVKSGGISVSLRSDPAVTGPGGTFSLTLVVRNLSSKPFSWTSPSGQTYEFLAFDKGGSEVWRWSEGKVFIQIVTQVTIAPSETKVYKVAWNTAGTAAGLYTIQGYFLGLPTLRPSVSVEITP